MKRLRTDYVDLYYLHRLNEAVAVENVATVMGRLIDEGLIRRWGLSQVDVDTIEKRIILLHSVQFRICIPW